MTPSEEVVAAGHDGLVYFMRVQDHPSKPWSESRPFPQTKSRLDASTVTGLALHLGDKGSLHVYCVAKDKLHAFSRSGDPGSPFLVDPSPPFARFRVSGTPAVASTKGPFDKEHWCLIAPCRSGGVLYTSTRPQSSYYAPSKQSWEPANQVAANIGIISTVSVAATHAIKSTGYSYSTEETTNIVAVCIAGARLHSIEGPFKDPSSNVKFSWQDPKTTRIQHPGEVTGNPVLLGNKKFGTRDYKLDLLVPSADGGIFHFIRTAKSIDEWHMIGRISFPTSVPIASSLSCARLGDETSAHRSRFRAHVQCGGRLYLIMTIEGSSPWVGSQLYPIEGPGPFLY